MEAEIGDCTCAHCSYHRAVGAALDEHFRTVKVMTKEELLAREKKLREATNFFIDGTQKPAISAGGQVKGRPCLGFDERGNAFACPNKPGTSWSAIWCDECDRRRLGRISAQMEGLMDDLKAKNQHTVASGDK